MSCNSTGCKSHPIDIFLTSGLGQSFVLNGDRCGHSLIFKKQIPGRPPFGRIVQGPSDIAMWTIDSETPETNATNRPSNGIAFLLSNSANHHITHDRCVSRSLCCGPAMSKLRIVSIFVGNMYLHTVIMVSILDSHTHKQSNLYRNE